MTAVSETNLDRQQHLVLDGVSWDLYERLRRDVGDQNIRMVYDDGKLEIMSRRPKHEKWGARLGRLIELMCFELEIDIEPLGSTTFRDALKRKGLEPDECYYVLHAREARIIKEEFDPIRHLPPDLAIEVDITSESVGHEPIYAALGVSELWRFDGEKLDVRMLAESGNYQSMGQSEVFPFLPLKTFLDFVKRLEMNNRPPFCASSATGSRR